MKIPQILTLILCFLTSILLGGLFPSHQQDQSNPKFLQEEEGDNHLTS